MKYPDLYGIVIFLTINHHGMGMGDGAKVQFFPKN